MKKKCPNQDCSYYQLPDFVTKDGRYFRKNDSRKIQRYKCKNCKKKFSSATDTLEYGQKKRRINQMVYKLLASKVSQRRIGIILGVSKNTIARKQIYLGKKCKIENQRRIEKMKDIQHIQIDDLITKEKSKLKPVTTSVAVNGDTGEILGVEVAQIPSFGHLAKLSRKKYGHRECHHKVALDDLFGKIKPAVFPFAQIRTDEHKKYPEFVKKYFPDGTHSTFKSERATVAGQGELKKSKNDPIFFVNHTCAMMRDGINRLVRKSWCVSQSIVRLRDHLEIYIHYFNNVLLPRRQKKLILSPSKGVG